MSQDNIVFGAPFDEERYNKVIRQCGLQRDLELFEAGDKTEVGEKGLTDTGVATSGVKGAPDSDTRSGTVNT